MAKRENTETALAVVESREVEVSLAGLAEALHATKSFASSARRSGEESTTPRRLTWLTGNNNCFGINGKTPLPAARGWFIDIPDEDEMFPEDYELMDAMAALGAQGKARECQVEHQDETGKPRRVPSWELFTASLFVVCEGIPSRSEMDKDGTDRWGVAYGWQPGGDGRSQLRFLCFVKELMDNGYNGLFIARFSSYCTDKAIAALKAQDYVLKFVDGLRAKSGEAEPVPYYAYALPIKCSTKTKTAGKVGKSTEIYYPVPDIARLSVKDPDAALDYLASVAITDNQAYVVEYNGRVEQAIEWSVKESARILAGRDADDQVDDAANTAPVSDVNPPF